MTHAHIFWAQALDNLSPDHIDMCGVQLSPEDTARRQEAVSLVSSVVKKGTRIFDRQGVQLTADDHHFVAEVLSVQRDHAGRAAPIVCRGEYDRTVGDATGEAVATGLDDFARRIQRTIHPKQLELARQSFGVLKKKFWRKTIGRAMAMVAAVLVVVALAHWLLSQGFGRR